MTFNYCPNCGKQGTVAQQNKTDYECSNCQWHFWNNPRGTSSIIFINKDGQVLMSKRGIDPKKGGFDFPGGFQEYGEDPMDAAIREVREEAGMQVPRSDLYLLGVWSNEYLENTTSTSDVMYVVTDWQGEFKPADDVESFEWKPIEFINDEQFAWHYPGMIEALDKIIEDMQNSRPD